MMNKQHSAYLDLMRVICAVLVVLSHLGHGHLVGGVLWPFTYFGNEAVMAFFVLSGFVIAYVTDQREKSLSVYAAARLARLYSVILPAMALTAVLDAIGLSINAESYANAHVMSDGGALPGYILSAVMLNKSWGLSHHFGSDGAYWSIPYEFWYYFIFGAFSLLTGWRRVVYACVGLAIAGPDILVMFPVWLMGVGAYYLLKRRQPGYFWLAAALCGLVMLAAMLWTDFSSLGKGRFLGMLPNSLSWQYLIGLCVAVHIYGVAHGVQWFSRFFETIKRPLAWSAGSTLALYLFHLPVIAFIHAMTANAGHTLQTTAALVVAPFAVALTVGHWCERQKKPLREWLLSIWQSVKARVLNGRYG